MPLWKSSKQEAVGENIKREEAAGKPKKQAVAIALDVQRKAAGGNRKAKLEEEFGKYELEKGEKKVRKIKKSEMAEEMGE